MSRDTFGALSLKSTGCMYVSLYGKGEEGVRRLLLAEVATMEGMGGRELTTEKGCKQIFVSPHLASSHSLTLANCSS